MSSSHHRHPSLIQPLFTGPLDLIGDVHGGAHALEELLQRLGYDQNGIHPKNRRLVFLGDLVDRGENSPKVVTMVAGMVVGGNAQCVLGNHELNILINHQRPGAEWYWGGTRLLSGDGRPVLGCTATATEKTNFIRFAGNLPLALVRDDLRVVHACWHQPSINQVRAYSCVVTAHRVFEEQVSVKKKKTTDRRERWLIDQNENPVKVITSGLERATTTPFKAEGKLRLAERTPWWEDYRDRQAVVFGHYWHSQSPLGRLSKIPSPFPFHHRADTPLGPRRNAWCIDFSNGHRNEELLRRPWSKTTIAALAALRWPEREIVVV